MAYDYWLSSIRIRTSVGGGSSELDGKCLYGGCMQDLNDNTYHQLCQNDSTCCCLSVNFNISLLSDPCFANTIDWEKDGWCISNNTHLKMVYLNVSSLVFTDENQKDVIDIDNAMLKNIMSFVRALSLNKSICSIDIDTPCGDILLWNVFSSVSPIFQHSIQELGINEVNFNDYDDEEYTICVQTLDSVLQSCTTKYSLSLGCNTTNDEQATELIRVLSKSTTLSKLTWHEDNGRGFKGNAI